MADGRGVDHVIEVGGPRTFSESLRATARRGQIHVIGYPGGKDGAINPLEVTRQIEVRGIPVGSRESFEAMIRAIEALDIKPVIDRSFSWRDAADAIRYLENGSHFGKVALVFDGTAADGSPRGKPQDAKSPPRRVG